MSTDTKTKSALSPSHTRRAIAVASRTAWAGHDTYRASALDYEDAPRPSSRLEREDAELGRLAHRDTRVELRHVRAGGQAPPGGTRRWSLPRRALHRSSERPRRSRIPVVSKRQQARADTHAD